MSPDSICFNLRMVARRRFEPLAGAELRWNR
jgi:hypothetical protein